MLRAITVRNPWAWAILHGKPVENRGREWPIGEYALHCSKMRVAKRNVPVDFLDEMHAVRAMARAAGTRLPPSITYRELLKMSGCIVGMMRVTDCVTEFDSPWFVGPIGLVLADVVELKVPVPCKGSLGPWIVPPAIERAVREQLR